MHSACLCAALTLVAAEPGKSDSELVQAWLAVSLKHAQDYTICPVGKPDRPFSMVPHAIFRHSQPVRGDDIGAVYLWVDQDERPAVIGTTFAYTLEGDLRAVVHEFHSLAAGPITATWRGRQPWRTTQAGLEFRPIPNAPAPAEDSKQRQRQIRDLARRFSAESIDHQGKSWQLRRITKPVHQFDVENPTETLGGAILLFCQGTDPELIFAIEAREQGNGYEWVYAAASFTDFGLKLHLDDKEAWSAEPRAFGPTQPHWGGTASKERLPEPSNDGPE